MLSYSCAISMFFRHKLITTRFFMGLFIAGVVGLDVVGATSVRADTNSIISGAVRDESGKPIKGAFVAVKLKGERSIIRFSDASGAYKIKDVPARLCL